MFAVLHPEFRASPALSLLCRLLFLPLVLLAAMPGLPIAAERGEGVAKFPVSAFVVGVGEAKATGNALKDRRAAEVLARLEIAKQIKVQIRSRSIDVMCEGKEGALFPDGEACRNGFLQIVEETVDLFLDGTRIVQNGEREGIVFAVAVLERAPAAGAALEKSREAVERARAGLEKARGGDPGGMDKAREEYKKALVFEREREAISGVREQGKTGFEELEREILGTVGKER